MSSDTLLTFVHIVSSSIILGGELFLQCIVYPALQEKKGLTKDSPLIKIYDVSIPVTFGLVIAISVTGALSMFKLYDYFQDAQGDVLLFVAGKIGILMLLFGISAYQTFSLRTKMTGLNPYQQDTTDITSLAAKNRICSIIVFFCILIGLFLGVSVRG